MLDINDVREKCRNSINNTAVGQYLKQALDELEKMRHELIIRRNRELNMAIQDRKLRSAIDEWINQ